MEQVKYGLFADAPDLCVNHPSLAKLKKAFPAYVERAEQAQVYARSIARDLLLPKALDLDMKCGEDPCYVDWDLWKEWNRRKATLFLVPKTLGGLGWGALDAFVATEEWASAEVGVTVFNIANILWACAAFVEMRPANVIHMLKEMVRAQEEERRLFFSWALTEPNCGTDNLVPMAASAAKPSLRVEKVRGGYKLNGRKHFITNGNLARYVLFAVFADRTRPLETMCNFFVPTDTPGFSVGRVERKMGHKAKPTAELILDDVFVPEEQVWESPGRGMLHTQEMLSLTTGFIASLGVGMARGAIERTINFAYDKKVGNHRLIEENWVQIAIADMLQQINTVRAKYIDFAIGCDMMHVTGFMEKPWFKAVLRIAPSRLILSESMESLVKTKAISDAVSRWKHRNLPDGTIRYFKRQGSALKVAGSDLGMRVASRVLDVVGLEGMAHHYGIEKIYRDAKGSQIYEGANEVNLLSYFELEVAEAIAPC